MQLQRPGRLQQQRSVPAPLALPRTPWTTLNMCPDVWQAQEGEVEASLSCSSHARCQRDLMQPRWLCPQHPSCALHRHHHVSRCLTGPGGGGGAGAAAEALQAAAAQIQASAGDSLTEAQLMEVSCGFSYQVLYRPCCLINRASAAASSSLQSNQILLTNYCMFLGAP